MAAADRCLGAGSTFDRIILYGRHRALSFPQLVFDDAGGCRLVREGRHRVAEAPVPGPVRALHWLPLGPTACIRPRPAAKSIGMNEKSAGIANGLTNYGDRGFSLYLRRSFAPLMGYSLPML